MTPSPPCCAIAIARRDSVTVSIAALTRGTERRMRRVSRVATSTSRGTTSECRGTSRTSSKVRAVASPVSVESRVGNSVLSSIGVLGGSAVTLLVLFTAPAPAGIVAANLRLIALHGLDDVVAADARRLLLAARRAERARGRLLRADGRKRRRRGSARVVQDQRRLAARHRTPRGLVVLVHDRAQAPRVADNRFVHAFLHVLEKREAFFLVLDERIALPVAAEADAFLQVVEAVKVILPVLIDDLQHNVALDATHQ